MRDKQEKGDSRGQGKRVTPNLTPPSLRNCTPRFGKSDFLKRGSDGVPLWCSELRIWCGHWSSSGRCFSTGSIPSPGISIHQGCGQKKGGNEEQTSRTKQKQEQVQPGVSEKAFAQVPCEQGRPLAGSGTGCQSHGLSPSGFCPSSATGRPPWACDFAVTRHPRLRRGPRARWSQLCHQSCGSPSAPLNLRLVRAEQRDKGACWPSPATSWGRGGGVGQVPSHGWAWAPGRVCTCSKKHRDRSRGKPQEKLFSCLLTEGPVFPLSTGPAKLSTRRPPGRGRRSAPLLGAAVRARKGPAAGHLVEGGSQPRTLGEREPSPPKPTPPSR